MDNFRGMDYVLKARSGCNERPGSQNLAHSSYKSDFLQQEHYFLSPTGSNRLSKSTTKIFSWTGMRAKRYKRQHI